MLGLDPEAARESAAATPAAGVSERTAVAGLSDAEAEALLLKELEDGSAGKHHG
jgi:DNA-directed RNA polymerase specialized sigma24 family protein